jgi:hypothetical protein
MITHIRVKLTRDITETLGTESMRLFYEQSIPHPSGDTLSIDGDSCSSSSAPTIPSWAGYHLQQNSPSPVLAPSSPVPAVQAQRTSFQSPGRDVEPTVRRLVSCTSTPASKYQLHGLVKTAFGPDPFRITSVIDSSHRLLDRATRKGKHGPMSGTGPSAGNRAATPPQTNTRVEISRNTG